MLNGGLGDAVARVLVTENPVPMETIGVNDAFGQSGLPMQLMDEYRLNAKAIIEAATRLHARKQS